MLKLYYMPGACSLAPHILLIEAALAYRLELVSSSKRTADGRDYFAINPHGYVPSLELADGYVLTEGPVIMQYIADQAPACRLIPAEGTLERYRVLSWLNFITSEIHKGFGPLFADDTPIHYKPAIKDRLRKRFSFIAQTLDHSPFLTGDQFSIADAHLWVMVNWIRLVGIDPDAWPSIERFRESVGARRSVRAAVATEGLAW